MAAAGSLDDRRKPISEPTTTGGATVGATPMANDRNLVRDRGCLCGADRRLVIPRAASGGQRQSQRRRYGQYAAALQAALTTVGRRGGEAPARCRVRGAGFQ